MQKAKQKAALQGALFITIASLLSKVLSAFYKIPYQNIAGDLGYYIYQQVYPVYAIALAFSTYGFPLVLSSYVAERLAKKDEKGAKELVYATFMMLLLIGTLCFLTLYIGSNSIAQFMRDEHLAMLIRVVSVGFLFVPITSAFRGYYQGLGDMGPTSISQVIEQLIRVVTILVLSIYLMQTTDNLYVVGAGAVSGSILGSIAAILYFFYWVSFKGSGLTIPSFSLVKKYRFELKTILYQGILLSLSSLVLVFIQFIDSISFYPLLVQYGYHVEGAKLVKGIYDRGFPLIQLGAVIASSFSLALIPYLSRELVRKEHSSINNRISAAIRVSIVVGAAATVGLVSIIHPTNIMLYRNDLGTDVLSILCISIFFAGISITTSSIAQGLGKSLIPALNVFAGGCVKFIGNVILMEQIGSKGAAYSTVIALIIVTILNLAYIYKLSKVKFFGLKFILKLLISLVIMYYIVLGYEYIYEKYSLFINPLRLRMLVEALTSAGVGAIVFTIVLIKIKLFTVEELSSLIKSKKLQKWLS
ncbi:putative polysaccharide biosynthesis protein [Gottfriedia solisilvae]|uniref:Sugar transporter n=1 Tax=Gottfriedia solisilvae TaxID=1516104 RepID=A0A8J3F2H8_9BACI|nr:polysaccharide biosynthesis protein [Gottfriedia solisilvae]GGI18397.1 sugar transporter [Gottfriedia solisilvae]